MRRDDETTHRDGRPPQQDTDTERPTVILSANEFRIAEVLRHIEAGRIVLIIPPATQRGPPTA